MQRKRWKKMLIWLMSVSLVLPGMSGFAAEEMPAEQAQILEMEDMDEIDGFQDHMFPEEGKQAEGKGKDEMSEADCEVQILEIEEMDSFEDLVEISVDLSAESVGEYQEVTVTGETEWVSESGLASSASVPDFQVYTASEYSGSYGAQLEGRAAEIYAALADVYVTQKKADETQVSLEKGYTFEITDLGYDEKGTHLWDQDGEAYEAAKEEMRYEVQSAYDAFMYDYPEVFWFSAFSYKWSLVLYINSATKEYVSGAVKNITITPKERYQGASKEISSFEQAVEAAAAQIAFRLPEHASPTEIIEEIHDYLCFKVVYQENNYAHTAAGVFLKGGAVVCEGYAKAFKILCSRFGIESVLIPGGALKANGTIEGHMWNYVKIDGNWYMIDTTWDDQVSYVSKVYFLVGSSSQGFNEVISEERTLFTKFSGSNVNSQSFVLPVLGKSAYTGTWHEWYTAKTVDADSTCSTAGSKSNHCRKCGEIKQNSVEEVPMKAHSRDEGTVTLDPTCSVPGQMLYVCTVCGSKEMDEIEVIPHTWEDEYTLDLEATCTEKGSKSVHCEVCDAKDESTVTAIDATGHSWNDGEVTIEPTCISVGQLTYTCFVCNAEEYDEIPVTEHIWETEYTIDQNPTCTAYGQESVHCSYCDAINAVSGRKIERLEASFNAEALRLQTGQKTNKLKVSGLVGGDYIKSWKSGNKKIVRVNQKGRITAQSRTGTADIIITLANDEYGTSRTYRIPVTVQKKSVKTLQITGVEKKLTIKKGERYTLQPELVPFTSQQVLTYTSSKPGIAAVSAKGVITAKAAGKTKISVRSGGKSLTVTVTVPKAETEKIKARKKVSVKAGNSVVLKVQVTPSNSDQKLRFVSKNKKVAIVDQNGRITGKKKGKAKIVVKSGTVTHICTVTVK